MKLSIVIPAYNEAERFKKNLKKVEAFLENYCFGVKITYEIIVVDDGSTDKTVSVIEGLGIKKLRIIRNRINRGKGNAVKRGILNARALYPFILYMDIDLATPMNELYRFMVGIEDYDIIIGSRNMKHSEVTEHNLRRRLLGKLFSWIVRLTVLRGIKDTQTGFKLFKTDVAKRLVKLQTLNGFCFDVELLYHAKRLGYKIKEVPITWVSKEGSTVRPFIDSFKMLRDLWRIK